MVRDGDENQELRYSLRSLKNIPHENVYLVGYKPSWVKNVQHIERFQKLSTKYKNITLNMYAACNNENISEDFIYMDDDFFLIESMEDIYPFHRGKLDDLAERYRALNSRTYADGLEEISRRLKELGIASPLSYELHIPMLFNKKRFKHILELDDSYALRAPIFHVRSFYGNYYNIGGQHMNDVKIYWQEDNRASKMRGRKFISSSDDSFKGYITQYLRELFPEKSQYE